MFQQNYTKLSPLSHKILELKRSISQMKKRDQIWSIYPRSHNWLPAELKGELISPDNLF